MSAPSDPTTAPITVGYWSIRGLGAPLRMMVMYANRPLVAQNYDCKENSSKDGFDVSAWFDVKEDFKAKNPLINLPYVQDGEVIVTQTNACFAFLGRKLHMMGSNELEQVHCEQLLCEIMDVRNAVVGLAYGRRQVVMADWLADICKHGGGIYKLNLWLERKYGNGMQPTDNVFFVGSTATAPDFHIWEILDQILVLAELQHCENPLTGKYPMLFQFHKTFRNLPGNTRYFASDLAKLPMNNMMAKFGAIPSGGEWVYGSEHNWSNSSGTY